MRLRRRPRRVDAGFGAVAAAPGARARRQRRDLAEAQGVESTDRPRPHGEDVADDAAHSRGRSLVGLDGGRVVVALDLHGHGHTATDVHDAGVLARPLQDVLALGGEAPE